MNDEIKEILDYFRKYATIRENTMISEIEDCITNLQQENERLKETIDKSLDMLIVVYGGNDEYYVKTIEKARNILQNGSENDG